MFSRHAFCLGKITLSPLKWRKEIFLFLCVSNSLPLFSSLSLSGRFCWRSETLIFKSSVSVSQTISLKNLKQKEEEKIFIYGYMRWIHVKMQKFPMHKWLWIFESYTTLANGYTSLLCLTEENWPSTHL